VACGLPAHGATSLSALAGRRVTVAEMRPIVERHLAAAFALDLRPAPAEEAAAFAPLAAGAA
jgi:hypothetical protein